MKLSLPAASSLAALKMPAFLRIKLSGVLWFFGILLTGMVSGALTAVGGIKAVAVIAGAVLGGLALAFLSLDRIFICQVVLIYLVVGQMQYFAHISKAFWIPYLLGAALLITLPMTLMGRKQNTKNRTILSYLGGCPRRVGLQEARPRPRSHLAHALALCGSGHPGWLLLSADTS